MLSETSDTMNTKECTTSIHPYPNSMCIHLYKCMYVGPPQRPLMNIGVRMYVCMYVRKNMYILYICMYVQYVCTYACMYVCTYIYVCMNK